jgi:hypothetical protein
MHSATLESQVCISREGSHVLVLMRRCASAHVWDVPARIGQPPVKIADALHIHELGGKLTPLSTSKLVAPTPCAYIYVWQSRLSLHSNAYGPSVIRSVAGRPRQQHRTRPCLPLRRPALTPEAIPAESGIVQHNLESDVEIKKLRCHLLNGKNLTAVV